MIIKQLNYATVSGPRHDLPEHVTKLQKEGWITVGGIHVTADFKGAVQAMVLPAPEKKVTDYVLVTEDNAEALQKAVNSMLKQGWSLHGGPAMSLRERRLLDAKIQTTNFAQAMVKYNA